MTSTITIIAHSGHNLIAADGVLRKTSSDPYLKFRAGNVRARTKYVLKTLNPVWDETVVLRHIGMLFCFLFGLRLSFCVGLLVKKRFFSNFFNFFKKQMCTISSKKRFISNVEIGNCFLIDIEC